MAIKKAQTYRWSRSRMSTIVKVLVQMAFKSLRWTLKLRHFSRNEAQVLHSTSMSHSSNNSDYLIKLVTAINEQLNSSFWERGQEVWMLTCHDTLKPRQIRQIRAAYLRQSTTSTLIAMKEVKLFRSSQDRYRLSKQSHHNSTLTQLPWDARHSIQEAQNYQQTNGTAWMTQVTACR